MSADSLTTQTEKAPLKPHALLVDPDAIPEELKNLVQFVGWRYEPNDKRDEWTKVPKNPKAALQGRDRNASTTNAGTWGTFEQAWEAYRMHPPMAGDVPMPDDPESVGNNGLDGIGLVLSAGNPYCGIDLDKCLENGQLVDPDAIEALEMLSGTYAEISPSGTGIRVFCVATKPGGRCKTGTREMYDQTGGRFLTVTGHTYGGPCGITEKQEAINTLYARWFTKETKAGERSDASTNSTTKNSRQNNVIDDEILLERMFASKHGAAIKALWDGDTSAYATDKHDGESEADLALTSYLGWWTNYDPNRTDQLFKQSARYRPKWDEMRGAQTYGQKTIDKAFEGKGRGDGYSGGQDDFRREKTQGREKVVLEFDLYVQAQDIITALHEVNDPPVIFQRGRELSRIVTVEGKPSIEPFNVDSIRNFAQSRLECVKLVKKGEDKNGEPEYEEVPANLSRTVGAYILTSSHWPFPELRGIVYAPHFSAAGELVANPGYSPQSRLYLDLGGFTPRPVPTHPTATEVEAAQNLILNDLLPDFPFIDEASRAHAVALGLLPYVRTMIDGPTPLHGSDASTPGTGKSLMVEVLTYAATGLLPKIMSEGRDDDEWRKRITSTLLDSPTAVMIDNITRRLDSGSLSAAVTSRVWTDRKLGQSQNVSIQNLACWTVTGNNLTTSKEIARRLLWIRLDAKMERPWERTEFRHPKIMEWVNLNRHAVVHAFLTLAQNWIAKGKPKGANSLGSFEAWSDVVGGILEAAGISGFLGNLEDLYDRADAESREWRSFVELWAEAYGDEKVGTAALYALAVKNEVLLTVLGDKSEMSQKVRLGRALTAREDRVIGNYIIMKAPIDSHNKVQQYYLAPAPAEKVRGVEPNPPQNSDDLRGVENTPPAEENAASTHKRGVAGGCGGCGMVPCVCTGKEDVHRGVYKNTGADKAKPPATPRTSSETTARTAQPPAGGVEKAPSTPRTTPRTTQQPPAEDGDASNPISSKWSAEVDL